MNRQPITVIQTQPDMPPGLLAAWARVRALELDVRRVDLGETLPEPEGAVAILGSDASVGDRSVPWLAGLRAWTAAVIDAGVPTLGIDFGARLVAQLLGAEVVPAPAPAAGWLDVDSAEPWLPAGPWLAWHSDVIVAPDGLDTLDVVAGHTEAIEAFTSGRDGRHLGVQFHPEATVATIAAWAPRAGLRSLADRATLNAQTARHSAGATARARDLFDHWAQGVELAHRERGAVVVAVAA
jgi:GMP synthase (glutamine-hydrolysing)